MTKEQREELKNGIMPLLNTICSMRGLGFDDVEKELLDFIESEVEKAKKEGRNGLVKEIRKSIKEDMEIMHTEEKHFEIDKDIVKILNDKEITKMFTQDNDDVDLYGGWGWYS